MHGEVILIVFLLVFGCAALIFGVIYVVGQMLSGIGRILLRLVRPVSSLTKTGPATASPQAATVIPAGPVACPNPRCRKIEIRTASYCSQCGFKMNGKI